MRSENSKKEIRSIRRKILLISLAMLISVGGWWGWQNGRPWVKGIQAYMYAFPMIVMDITREVSTAVPSSGEITAPSNQFAVMTEYPDATFRLVPRTGLDTKFATAWADLEAEPLVLSVPYTGGRYYVIALFDMWSNVFASIGNRTTGTDSLNFLITGPKWKGIVPAEFKNVYESPTRYVWVNGQMQSSTPKDHDIVNSLEKRYKLTPLSAWGKPFSHPKTVTVNPKIDTKTAVLEQIKNMSASEFWSCFARLMKDNPPTADDAAMIEKLNFLGIIPGNDFDIGTVKSTIVRALNRSMSTYSLLEKGVQKLETKEGWIVIPANFANYGTDYLTRAGIALIGLGGIWPIDILYPTAFNDGEDNALDASKKYKIHMEKGQLPPAKATWSVSMYNPDGFYVPNSINRYHLAEWMPMKYNNDGSLDIYIQSESPGAEKEANWLPSPKSGAFSLTTRIFWPEEDALNGAWYMPGIKIVN